ncbi:I78 family peptidase inhibitor [Solicola sp. PLA-1-18]|uniref:I78 family peptidase inhibitor n=1 Tax=Solicola sp. PLA-1-18 TaxID=3380532 RepID=UPI003B7C189A
MSDPTSTDGQGETDWFSAYADLGKDDAIARAQADGRRVRVLEPGMMMTMDWRPDRLNVHLDASGHLDHLAPG